jgi:hypothetical protein
MEASKMLAKRAQQSAEEVEKMTREMHEIAVKTKQETVSMKIITLVTLFFLPGTFISVSGNPLTNSSRRCISKLPLDIDEHPYHPVPNVPNYKQATEDLFFTSFTFVPCNHLAVDVLHFLGMGYFLLVGQLEREAPEIQGQRTQRGFQCLTVRIAIGKIKPKLSLFLNLCVESVESVESG